MKIFTQEMMHPYFMALDRCRGIHQAVKHHPEGDVFNHSIQTLYWAFRESIDTDLILAAMLHDVGKAVNSLGHEKIAVGMLNDFLSEKSLWLIEHHMRIWYLIKGEMKKLSKIQKLIEHPFIPDLLLLARWDKLARNPNKMIKFDKDQIIRKLNWCAEQHFKPLKGALDGN